MGNTVFQSDVSIPTSELVSWLKKQSSPLAHRIEELEITGDDFINLEESVKAKIVEGEHKKLEPSLKMAIKKWTDIWNATSEGDEKV